MRGRRVVLLLLALSPTLVAAVPAPQATLSTSEIARRAIPAVVMIRGTDADGHEISGSGFLVAPNGLLITNLHVITELRHATIRLSNGDVYDRFSVRSFDERRDLAVLKLSGFALPSLACGNSDSVQVGDPVALVGNPLQLQGSLTSGVISGIRTLEDEGYRVIQTDAAANPGNSGGPLIDGNGRAIGVLTFKLRGAENVSFVVPINYARGMLADSSAFSLDEMRSKLEGVEPIKTSAMLPARWRSLTSGTFNIVRVAGDRVYANRDVTVEERNAGVFATYDLIKTDSIYVGKCRVGVRCTVIPALAPNYDKACTVELPCVITLLSASRIEGVIDAPPTDGSEFDCRNCRWRGTAVKMPFVWIPE